MFKVKIFPSNISFISKFNLLDDALIQSIPLEYSCKTGECGCCKVDLLSGQVETVNGEVISSGEFLTCQCKALSDIEIKAKYYPELTEIKQQTVPCKVSSFEYVTDDILVIKFRLPPMVKFQFLSGQYVDLINKNIKRSYSIANSHKTSNEIEIHVRKVSDGKMSHQLFDKIEINQLMRIEGPKGTFFIRNGVKPLILLAGGTGIAPVKAIVEELISNNDKREIYIYWGMPLDSDFYLPILEQLAIEFSYIHYIPVASESPDFNGRKGLVHQAVCEDFHSLSEFDVYACGSPIMIEAAKKSFFEKELSSESFYSDAFTPAK